MRPIFHYHVIRFLRTTSQFLPRSNIPVLLSKLRMRSARHETVPILRSHPGWCPTSRTSIGSRLLLLRLWLLSSSIADRVAGLRSGCLSSLRRSKCQRLRPFPSRLTSGLVRIIRLSASRVLQRNPTGRKLLARFGLISNQIVQYNG